MLKEINDIYQMLEIQKIPTAKHGRIRQHRVMKNLHLWILDRIAPNRARLIRFERALRAENLKTWQQLREADLRRHLNW